MKLTPYSTAIWNMVIVKRSEAPDKSHGGIIIPDTAQERPEAGEVVAVGKGRWLDTGLRLPPCVKVGDKVLFERFQGTNVELEGVPHVVLIEQQLLAVVE
jgi:chaperonin GroES